jgi:hypothetical protein
MLRREDNIKTILNNVHVQCMGDTRDAYRVLVGNLREGDRFEIPGLDRRMILKSISEKWDVGSWTGLIWLRIGTGGGSQRMR